MAPKRTPLAPISANKGPRKELTPFERGQIQAWFVAGLSQTDIAKALKRPRQTIHDALKNSCQNPEGESLPRSGRPPILSSRDRRLLVREVRKHPKSTYKELKKATGLNHSDHTLRRVLKAAGITHWIAKKRPKLTPKNAAIRLEWGRKHQHWTVEQWSKVRFSDECSVELGAEKGIQWVFGYAGEQWDPDKIKALPRGKGLRVMVWAAIWGAGISDLYPLERDFESKKHGYSAASYIKILEDNIGAIWGPKALFQQDNAKIHSAKKTKKWFEDAAIPVLEWPPYSPDMNPIEHMWALLKRKLLYISYFLVSRIIEAPKMRLESTCFDVYGWLGGL